MRKERTAGLYLLNLSGFTMYLLLDLVEEVFCHKADFITVIGYCARYFPEHLSNDDTCLGASQSDDDIGWRFNVI